MLTLDIFDDRYLRTDENRFIAQDNHTSFSTHIQQVNTSALFLNSENFTKMAAR